MTLEIIGAGLGRTATRSLQMALEQLGYAPCHHMFEINDHPEQATPFLKAARGDLGPMIEFCGRYRAVVDWPAAAFWRPLSEAYPEAKVILSVRPAEGWHASVLATIYPSSRAIMMARPAELGDVPDMLDEVIWKGTFDGRFRRKEHAIEVYEAHNAEVRAALAPDRLLVYEAGSGWEPICEFLGVEVPDRPYPNSNTRTSFDQESGMATGAGNSG
jgi:hypothetical protein